MRIKTLHVAMAIVIAVFIKGCVLPGWPALFELLASCSLLGFVIWFNPEERKQRDELSNKIEKQNETISLLRQDIGMVKAKIGMMRG